MKVILEHRSGVNFVATTESGHQIEIDGSPVIGGQDKGGRPMEMVLIGLGGCSAIDVMTMLEKMRQQVTDCRIEIDANRVDAVPAVFSDIHLSFSVNGKDLDSNKVGRAVSLSAEKYCSVSRMLAGSVAITHDFKVIEE
jgi:putative redox protein